MGLTVVDAGVLIGLADAGDAHHASAVRAFQAAWDRQDRIAIPASAYSEALVNPARSGPKAFDAMREFVAQLPMGVISLDAAIAEAAARLRQRHAALRLPDALVVATAIHIDADVLVTTDRRWPRRSALGFRGNLVVLSADN